MRTIPDFSKTLLDARKDLDKIKTRQFAGASDIQIILNDSGNTTDYHLTGAPAQLSALTIDFTSTNMDYAFVDLSWRVFLDSSTNEVFPGDTNYPYTTDYLQFPKSPTGVATDINVLPKVTRFVFHHSGPAGHDYYYKFYCQATDTGSFIFS
jgi:hypothetical protein